MVNKEIIELLKEDMMGEHQAIIQYLNHAYAIGEGEIACEVEAIAREEMRHLDWLADAIGELGGDPTMERAPVDFGGGAAAELMLRDVELEETGIAQYQSHIDAIEDPKIRGLLARILHDEEFHREQFADLAEEAREEEAPEPVSESGAGAEGAKAPKRMAEILNEGIRHEYTVILQYLYHSFVAEGKELSEEVQNRAINEMQHMGWLSEELRERGGEPDMTHADLFLSRDPVKNLEADIAAEREVTQAYSSQLPEIDEEDLRKLIARIRDHEIYHDVVFNYLLDEVKEELEGEGEES